MDRRPGSFLLPQQLVMSIEKFLEPVVNICRWSAFIAPITLVVLVFIAAVTYCSTSTATAAFKQFRSFAIKLPGLVSTSLFGSLQMKLPV